MSDGESNLIRDPLTGRLAIWQRADGHKAASDDVVLAAFAARCCPGAQRVLDLGTGKGTVALLLSQLLPESHLVGVEAFEESYLLALKNIAENGLEGRFQAHLGDLREPRVLNHEPPFDLVTGAPPFMRLGSGPLPRDPQRAAGRFELRGGVEAYAVTAARHLAADGVVVLLMDGAGGSRAERALTAAGLDVTETLDVLPRPGRPPTYQLVAAARRPPEVAAERRQWAMRDAEGETWSEAYSEIRRALDLPGI